MYLMDQLVLVMNTTSPDDSMHAFAEYVYHHFDSIGEQPIEELSRACALSAPTVSRLVKRLGFSSFRAFREQCAVLAEKYRCAEHGHDHFKLAPANVEEVFSRSIAPALATVDDRELDLFLDYLLPEGTTCLMGLANMHALAVAVQTAISSFRTQDVIAPTSSDALDRLGASDALIVLSSTGNLFATTDIAQHLRSCKARRLLLTTSNFDAHGLPFHHVVSLRSTVRQNLINNYLMQGFVDMALCRAGFYD